MVTNCNLSGVINCQDIENSSYHTHNNKRQLDYLGETFEGLPTYRGKVIKNRAVIEWASTKW